MTIEYRVTVNPRQLGALRRKLEPKQYAKILFDITRKAGEWGAEQVRAQHWDIGATTKNTVMESMSYGARIVTRSPGARAVEVGRHPGHGMPPPDVLAAWASRHGFPAEALFPLARAIARRGHRGRFFMRRTKSRLRAHKIPQLLHEAVNEIQIIWRRTA